MCKVLIGESDTFEVRSLVIRMIAHMRNMNNVPFLPLTSSFSVAAATLHWL